MSAMSLDSEVFLYPGQYGGVLWYLGRAPFAGGLQVEAWLPLLTGIVSSVLPMWLAGAISDA